MAHLCDSFIHSPITMVILDGVLSKDRTVLPETGVHHRGISSTRFLVMIREII